MACYLYGLVRPDRQPPESRGVQDADVRLLPLTALAAVVSDVSEEAVTEADAERHLDVLLGLLADGPVLPAQFGVMAPDEPSLAAQLERWQEALRDNLDRFADLAEVDVTVTDDEQAAIAAVVAEHPELRMGSTLVSDRIALGERIAERVLEHRAALADELLEELRAVSHDDVPRAELTSVEQPILRWAFLVRRTGIEEFDALVARLGGEHPELQIDSVGPLPPFAFSTINLSADQSTDQSAANTVDGAGSFRSGKWGW